MGYTHYWYRPQTIEQATYEAIVRDFRKILKPMRFDDKLGLHIDLANGLGEGKPEINNNIVRFNGRRSTGDDYETFCFKPTIEPHELIPPDEKGRHFEFCKTERRRYDIAVQVFLIIAKHHLGSQLKVTSDGCALDWKRAREIVEKYLGYDDFYLGDGE